MEKKITIYSPHYYPYIGGLENYARELNKFLVSRGYKVTLVTSRVPKSASFEEELDGVKIVRLPAFEIIPNYPVPNFLDPRLYRTLNKVFSVKNDLVLSHTRFFLTSLLAMLQAKRTKTKWVHIEHGSDFVKLNNPVFTAIAKLYDLTFGRMVLRSSDLNVCVSQAVAGFVRKFDSRQPLLVNFGMDKNDPIFAGKTQNKSKDIKVIFIGRLIDGKGVDLLLEAAVKVKDKNIQYQIVGDGSQKKNWENLAQKLKVADRVNFLGEQDHETTLKLLSESDIFVLPSYTEGLSVTMLEAAFCKTAIISTNVGGAPEVITDHEDGILTRPGNVNDIVDALNELTEDAKLREKYADKLYNKVSDRFGWETNFGKLIGAMEAVK